MVTLIPGLILIVGALALPLVKGFWRGALILLLPLLTLAAIWDVPDGPVVAWSFLSFELAPVAGSPVGRLFATIFAIMAFAGGLYAYRHARLVEMVAAYAYAGGAVGVAMAGDLVTVLIFWELMAIGSTIVVWCGGTPAAYRASVRYLMVHLFGGVVLMIGIVAYIWQNQTVAFGPIALESTAAWFILVGFLINTAAPPLSAWLPDAYPEGSPFGTVFLSAFTTKTAVFVLLVCFAGAELLIYVGLYMVFYGIVYAILENDMRRILAYSIVNQVGFMVTGIGIGTELALNGAASHAFAHIIYKALLLMSAGAVLYQTGKRKCTDLGGLYRTMPVTMWCGVIGALSISAFPLTSGFVSKSMISSAAEYKEMMIVWYLLAAATAGVFLHAGIKFPWFVFFQKDSGLRPPDAPLNMRLAMILMAFLCIGLGVYPDPLYAILPYPVDYQPYTGAHVVSQTQLLLFSGLAFFVMLPMLKRQLTITLDTDWVYRVMGPWLARKIGGVIGWMWGATVQACAGFVDDVVQVARMTHGRNSTLARGVLTGSAAAWILGVLVLFLIFLYN